jgi:hypothetical protein
MIDPIEAGINQTQSSYSREILRLHRLTVYARWYFIVFCWLTLGVSGVWGLRLEIQLWLEYFTWAAVRYGLATRIVSTLCLSFCVAITTSVLVWQSRNILFGLSPQEIDRLDRQLQRIKQTGPSHPLWQWVFRQSQKKS